MELDWTLLAVLAPIVTALIQVVKQFSFATTKLLPVLSVVCGLLCATVAVLAWPPALPLGQKIGFAVVHGLIAGLSAMGLYSAALKPATEAVKKLAA